jgi:hypothetical protein
MTFTTTAVQDVFITTHQSAIDTVVYVRRCSCAGTQVGCNDDADGRPSSALFLPNLPADTYQVFVDTRSSPVGTIVPVDIYISPPGMQSDRCGNPTPIAAGATSLAGNNCAPYGNDLDVVTDATLCPYAGDGDSGDRVYYFYLPTARMVTFAACAGTTNYDTVLSVRQVCNDASAPNQVACDDDGCTGMDTCASTGLRSSRTQMLGPGLFYLVVDGYNATGYTCPCGNYTLSLTGF